MANGFDRVERFFTKRKASAAAAQASADAALPPATSTAQPKFPSPSFIRPKARRMAAREEVIVKQAYCPSISESGNVTPPPMGSLKKRKSSLKDLYALYPSPKRSSPLRYRPRFLITDLREYQFPRPPTSHSEISPTSSFEQKSSSEISGYLSPGYKTGRKVNVVARRANTPPSSDGEEGVPYSMNDFRNKKLPPIPRDTLPTPETSPELCPVLESQLRGAKSIEVLNRSHRSRAQNAQDARQMSCRSVSSASSLDISLRLSLGSSTLKEPDFNDFLNLSDDDIAEETAPESPVLPHTKKLPSIVSSIESIDATPKNQPLLTLTPPYASPPAEAAAFEAARIANRYNFDLVYVINLWPEGSRPQTSGPDQLDSVSVTSDMSQSANAMTGRLLAAYGLHNVKSPFQISASVHGDILRSDGWIEYRNQEACDDEFARGYACAFYTGQYSRSNLASAAMKSTPKSKIDRGIVFAAYRKPRENGNMLGVGSSKDELKDIYRDAETLVELLIDVHAANRAQQPVSLSQQADETGPMPVPTKGMA